MKTKTLLKVHNGKGIFLWIDYEVAKLVVANILPGAKAGDTYTDAEDAWERGYYIHYWDYENDTLDKAIEVLED